MYSRIENIAANVMNFVENDVGLWIRIKPEPNIVFIDPDKVKGSLIGYQKFDPAHNDNHCWQMEKEFLEKFTGVKLQKEKNLHYYNVFVFGELKSYFAFSSTNFNEAIVYGIDGYLKGVEIYGNE